MFPINQLGIKYTQLSTVGDRAFLLPGSHLRSSLPPNVTSFPMLTVFRNRLQTYLFPGSFPAELFSVSSSVRSV